MSAMRSDSPTDEEVAAARRTSPAHHGSDDDDSRAREARVATPVSLLEQEKSFYDDEFTDDENTPAAATVRHPAELRPPSSESLPYEGEYGDFPEYNAADYDDNQQRWAEYDQALFEAALAGETVPTCDPGKEEDEAEFDLDFDNPEIEKTEFVGKVGFNIIPHRVDDSFLETDEPGAISRLVVIDAANILHGLTPIIDGYRITPSEDQKVDACYILSLVAFFVRKGIECVVVIQHKYALDKVTNNAFIIRTLQEMGLLMVMDKTYDDLVLFSVAAEFDAVILTEDAFRDERNNPEFMSSANVRNSLKLRVSPKYPRVDEDFLAREDRYSVTSNGHLVVDHLMRFEGSTDVLRKKFFSTSARGGHRFELVQEKYESWLRRKEEVKEALEALLATMKPILEKQRREVIDLKPRNN